VPTLDSIRRFLSADEQTQLWTNPAYNQYHTNWETDTSGYSFGTLYNFDTALANRYGSWSSLEQYVELGARLGRLVRRVAARDRCGAP
jgi:exo-1,4-beta-D-glucosaminidase